MSDYPKEYLTHYPTQSCPACGGGGEDEQGGQCPDCTGGGELPLATAPHTDLSTSQAQLGPDDQPAYWLGLLPPPELN
ncbi:hypothetical protein QMK33_22955 [Hymenobacter sp. H14-R3]|uniref:hypothetical protein n=1 Tax=Hymenobacter sp. H14-R3 TaxID=3046308 RepID=UPI0024B8FFFA|nr:hypothetical protein [Hymenobacter sp. H14-R3]MDJ0368012.1 hypothetical protein [Hymenobacter sp. H14-R3]